MILYSLRCGHGHIFDEWFSHSSDFEARAASGDIVCPACGDTQVEKAIMAPNVAGAAKPPLPACPMNGGCCNGACGCSHEA